MRIRGHRRAVVAVVAIAAAVLAGGAAAFWLVLGNGSTGSQAGTASAVTLTPATTSTPLFPGGTADVAVSIVNGNPSRIFVGSLLLDTGQGTNGFAVDAGHSGCNLAALGYTTADERRLRLVGCGELHAAPRPERCRLAVDVGCLRLPGRAAHRLPPGRPVNRHAYRLLQAVVIAACFGTACVAAAQGLGAFGDASGPPEPRSRTHRCGRRSPRARPSASAARQPPSSAASTARGTGRARARSRTTASSSGHTRSGCAVATRRATPVIPPSTPGGSSDPSRRRCLRGSCPGR